MLQLEYFYNEIHTNLFFFQITMEFVIKQEEIDLVVDTEVVNCDGESDVKFEANNVKIEAEDPLRGRFGSFGLYP